MLYLSKILQKSLIHGNFFLFEDERNGRDNKDNDKDNEQMGKRTRTTTWTMTWTHRQSYYKGQ